MNAAPLITSGTGQYKAVCHKCQYVGFEPNCTKCPDCGFPMLLEPYESARLTLRDIFDRSTIELNGRPGPSVLPGVNRTERQKREMLARAQRRLSSVHESESPSAPAMHAPQLIDRTAAPAAPLHDAALAHHERHAPAPLVSSLALAASAVHVSTSPHDMAAPSIAGHGAALARPRSLMPLAVGFMAMVAALMAMVAASGGL